MRTSFDPVFVHFSIRLNINEHQRVQIENQPNICKALKINEHQ